MADIISSPAPKGTMARSTLKAPRIDLTPMVDLGFLLITFFIFTTSMAKPKVMALQMPYDGPVDVQDAFPEESTLTIIPSKAHQCLIYAGAVSSPQMPARCGFDGENSLRKNIIAAKNSAAALPEHFSKDAHQLHVLIKPDATSSYEDLVCVLDEMSISDVKIYAILKEQEDDKKLLAAYGK